VKRIFHFSSILDNRVSVVAVVDNQMIVELAAAAAVGKDRSDMVLKEKKLFRRNESIEILRFDTEDQSPVPPIGIEPIVVGIGI
jgi:hypothetical protein